MGLMAGQLCHRRKYRLATSKKVNSALDNPVEESLDRLPRGQIHTWINDMPHAQPLWRRSESFLTKNELFAAKRLMSESVRPMTIEPQGQRGKRSERSDRLRDVRFTPERD
jgi:hypothetical protein